MTEERKHAILFAATLLCARKLIETIETDKPNFAKEYFVDRAIHVAELILDEDRPMLADALMNPAVISSGTNSGTRLVGCDSNQIVAAYLPAPPNLIIRNALKTS